MLTANRLREVGWICERVGDGNEDQIIEALPAVAVERALLVVDYAETRINLSGMLARLIASANNNNTIKVLLIARTVGSWWDHLGATDLAVSSMVQEANASQIILNPAVDIEISDVQVVDQAYKAFARSLGVSEKVVNVQRDATRRRMLDLHSAALVAVFDSSVSGPMTLAVNPIGVLAELLRHEQHYWYASARAAGLCEGPGGLSPKMLRQIVAVVCLLGAATEQEAYALIRRVPYMQSSINVVTWLRELYPPDPESPNWLGFLQPDRLAELHVIRELANNQELTISCLTDLTAQQAGRAVTLLGRAASDDRRAEALLEEILPSAAGMLGELNAPLEVLEIIYHAIPYPTIILGPDAVELIGKITNLLPTSCPPGVWASWKSELGHRLSDLGCLNEALPPLKEAVDVFRQLSRTASSRYEPDLARSLTSLGVVLTKLGHPDQGAVVTDEAVIIRRELAAIAPELYRHDLALSLNNLGLHFLYMRNFDQALISAEESAAIYREVVASSGRYKDGLAKALGNLANLLIEVGRPEEALPVTQESVAIFEELAAINPDRHRYDLALAVGNLAKRYWDLGRYEDGLPFTWETIRILRELGAITPERFKPDLAMALRNRGNHFFNLNRAEEALDPTRESIIIYREIAVTNPDRFQAELASALSKLGDQLISLYLHNEALPIMQEAAEIYRQLANASPDRYGPDLASILLKLERLNSDD